MSGHKKGLFAIFGSTMILTGTAIGAGMLALPMVSGLIGFWPTAGLLVFFWFLTTLSAFMILDVVLTLPKRRNNFHSMAQSTIGVSGQIVAWLAILLLLYALTCAYISGASSLLTSMLTLEFHWHIPHQVNAILFTIVFGSFVFWSTRAVDVFNRCLISIKGVALIAGIALLMPTVNLNLIDHLHLNHTQLMILAPIFLTSFGYHTVIPSIANYLGPERKTIQKIILVGAFIPLVIYLLWLFAVLGTVPANGPHSFATLIKEHGSVGQMMHSINHHSHSKWVTIAVNIFSNVAVTTSFLGVTLGLFDFLADGFKRSNHRVGRAQTALLTFIPPLIFAIFYPKGFIYALAFAGICVTVLEVIMPSIMVFSARRKKQIKGFSSHILTVGFVFVVGIGLLIIEVMGMVLH